MEMCARNISISLSMMVLLIIVMGIGSAYLSIYVRGSLDDGFGEEYALYLHSRLLLNYYEINGIANRLASMSLYPPLEFHDYMKTVEDILSSIDMLIDTGEYGDVIRLSTLGLEILSEANETLNKFMKDTKPIADSFYYYRQRFSRIYNNTLILLNIAKGIMYSNLDSLIPINLSEVEEVYSIAKEIRYSIYKYSIYELESLAKYLERRIYRYYYTLGIREEDIFMDVDQGDIIRRIKDLNSRLLDIYNLVMEKHLPRSHPIFRELSMLRNVLDDAEDMLLSRGDIYYIQYITIFCERRLTFVYKAFSSENILLETQKGSFDGFFIRFKIGGESLLLFDRSLPRFYIYLDKDVESYRVTVSLLTLFRDLDGDGYMDENEIISIVYLDELNWTILLNEEGGLKTINYVNKDPLFNITLSFKVLGADNGGIDTDILGEPLVSLDVEVRHRLDGEKGLRLGFGLLISSNSEDFNGGISDYITIREAIFNVGSSRWHLYIIGSRWADVEDVPEPLNTYIEEPKCCRKSLLYMSIVDYESTGNIVLSYQYYIKGAPMEAPSIADIIPVMILLGLILVSAILLLYLYKKELVDFSRLTRVPISR